MRKFVTGISSLVVLLLTVFIAPNVFAGEKTALRVENVTPGIADGQVSVSADFRSLFSPRIVGTIQSGLPSIVEIEAQVLDAGKKTIAETHLLRRILYNVWDERYTVQTGDTTLVFHELATMQNFCSRLEKARITPRPRLHDGQTYTVQVRVSITPISTLQSEKLSGWVQESNPASGDLPSPDNGGGFVMNLSKMVSFFLGEKNRPLYSSPWQVSRPFRPEELSR